MVAACCGKNNQYCTPAKRLWTRAHFFREHVISTQWNAFLCIWGSSVYRWFKRRVLMIPLGISPWYYCCYLYYKLVCKNYYKREKEERRHWQYGVQKKTIENKNDFHLQFALQDDHGSFSGSNFSFFSLSVWRMYANFWREKNKLDNGGLMRRSRFLKGNCDHFWSY